MIEEPNEVLQSICDRVRWLATSMIHVANQRPGNEGMKVGGHQSSSASLVEAMVALWFRELGPGDYVSVKPHAAPVFHAIQYLMGNLPASYLTTLRSQGGLQSYPSRSKDPDGVDFSTGSVGIGATATLWAALAARYSGTSGTGRFIALVGDAELDEGAVWEAVIDPLVAGLGEVLWIVDLNRQSLDRVIPDIQVAKYTKLFEACGWEVRVVKWGRRVTAWFELPGGERLRTRLDEMPNEEYQRYLRMSPEECHRRLMSEGSLREVLAQIKAEDFHAGLRDLGGHDPHILADEIRRSSRARPTVVLAYTVKGHGLPTEGHPNNHSALLTQDQMNQLASRLRIDPDEPWAGFAESSPEGILCRQRARCLARQALHQDPVPDVPAELARTYRQPTSSQTVLGKTLSDLVRQAPEVANRVVTCSPDVASSTNLGGWINKVGVWSPEDRKDWFGDDPERLIRWRETSSGQHIELGIAEVNLVGLAAELGSTWSRSGRGLIPVATVYDPFVARALEPWSFGMYAGGQSILVGTPSGVTLAAEGGAHQSIVTPLVGMGQPGCTAWEPAFAQDTEWCLLHAMGRVGRPDGESAYLRLSTRPIDPGLAEEPSDPVDRELRRRHVVAGGYRIGAPGPAEQVTIVGMGAVMPEVVAAAQHLRSRDIDTGVVCVTSADLLFRESARGLREELFPMRLPGGIVTVVDGHPHTLSFLAGVRGDRIHCLGVTQFGESSDVTGAYRHHGLDVASIVEAAMRVKRARPFS